MQTTTITLHPDFAIAPVDPRLFGGFLEHLGRAVYEGVYDPGSRHADANGFRQDVIEAMRPLRFTAMRYPGGNFASGYHWRDGVGPKSQRPVNQDLAWRTIEPNQFGTDEFIRLSRLLDWTPMLTVNLGTGTPEEARDWVEYCNSPTGTRWADLRAANGSPAPYAVPLWCLGNEMDGPWQIGHVPAPEYAIRAQQAAKLMRDTDPNLELVVCGSCTIDLPTYMEWDRTVMEYIGNYADYISLHRYVGNRSGDSRDYLAVTNSIDRQIEEMDAACRFVQARLRSKKRLYLCFDEWNVWYRETGMASEAGQWGAKPHLLEEQYTLEDALVVAGFLNSFLRHADSVKIANLAQIVNVIAPIQTRGDDLLLLPIYYPFMMFAQRREGIALLPAVKGPGYESKSFGHVNVIDAGAIQGDGVLHVFATNRSLEEPAPVTVHWAGGAFSGVASAEVLAGAEAGATGPAATNTYANPGLIATRRLEGVQIEGGQATFLLPPLSVAAVSLRTT